MNTLRALLAAVAIFLPSVLSAQDIIIDKTFEIDKTKSELFSITKSFIADGWSNAQKAISNEDAELGFVQVAADYNAVVKVGMGLRCSYDYDYKVRFRVKDGKCKVEIYDIVCADALQEGIGKSMPVPLVPYFEGEDTPKKLKNIGKGISKKQAIKMMDELRANMQDIIDSYIKYINSFSEDF